MALAPGRNVADDEVVGMRDGAGPDPRAAVMRKDQHCKKN